MSPPDAASLEKLSLAELRDRVGALISEVMRLRADNAGLQARAEDQEAAFAALKVETQALRDEVARLKGLPPRPPSRPSGMERSTGDGAGAGKARRKPVVGQTHYPEAAAPAGPQARPRRGDLRARGEGVTAARVALQGLRGPAGPRAAPVGRAGAAAAGALGDAVGRDGAGALAGGDRRRLRARAAALPAGGARPGAGDDGAAGGAAGGDRHRYLQTPGGAAADLAARRPGRRGPRRATRRAGHGALGDGGRHRRAARPP